MCWYSLAEVVRVHLLDVRSGTLLLKFVMHTQGSSRHLYLPRMIKGKKYVLQRKNHIAYFPVYESSNGLARFARVIFKFGCTISADRRRHVRDFLSDLRLHPSNGLPSLAFPVIL